MSGASSLQKGVVNFATMRSHDLQLFADILRSARAPPPVLHCTRKGPIMCRYCQRQIVGIRFKCLVCGFDICEECKSKEMHDASHKMLPIKGNTGLVFDSSLSGPLGLVLEMPTIYDSGISKIYLLGLTNSPRDRQENPSLVWVVRPNVETTKTLVACINQCEPGIKHTVCYVPRRSLLCDQILNDDPVARSCVTRITEFPLYLLPLDDDLLSMEAINDMQTSRIEGDPTVLFNAARALMKIQTAYGTIPHIFGKGQYAKQLCDMLLRMRNEAMSDAGDVDGIGPLSSPDDVPPEIGTLVIIDREVDMVTPMMTQLSFEGAIDELLGISNGAVELEAEIIQPPSSSDDGAKPTPSGKKLKYPLNSNDSVYYEMRHLNCLAVGKFMSQRARELSAIEQSRKAIGNNTHAMREFISKMAMLQAEKNSIRIFISVLEKVQAGHNARLHRRVETEQSLICGEEDQIEFIEECILRGDPFEEVLRLLIIQAQTRGGFKPKIAEQLKHEIVQTYGFEALFTLERFEKLGFLYRTQTRTPFSSAFRSLRLMPEDGIDEGSLQPQDPACAYSGYAPIICRIAEAASRLGGWKSIEDTLKALPGGPVFDVEQVPCSKKPPVTLVFVVGGITYGEVSAFRIQSRVEGGNHTDYIVATTKMVNGNSLVRSLLDTFPKPGQ